MTVVFSADKSMSEARRIAAPPPMALLAELTHRCPLACPYCSNPLELVRANAELNTEQWIEIFRQAAAMGVLHLHLSGGEPASRRDLVELTRAAAGFGLYTNLITSGVGLTEARIAELADAGLDHLQLSIQGITPEKADQVGGYRGGYARKMAVAEWTRAAGIPLTVNAVCHKQNMEEIGGMLDLAIALGARRIEIATVQFHGWAERNRQALMPTLEQVEATNAFVDASRKRLEGTLVIDYVPADHHARFPKACMGGWARIGLNVTPSGKVLPCHAAETIAGLTFDNATERPLAEIWYASAAFNAYRGDDWMQEPCRSCDRKHIDFGGCRCQAMALAGDPAATDPVCTFSPLRGELTAQAKADSLAVPPPFVYRGR
ncbi:MULTISPECIES: pyrroloquinoline quinone biosynthesis protein PqqE [unclassified Rhizobium]|uniref:pyrroloquinoline quinone biosynthesis protein PqqE n=1 Tax=unclassified Rhizobium TaxID=2613769 RepID=UPI001ADCDB84|nr:MULTISPECIES: pyrroloquinoline quinone biosynthesis protein PqqE [unclassified Rhizobium]MBO9098015.1 pyrroloquinoline quinone biosynthesis protein PqqE [Rhizobium sp. L58/93]MBO9133202.1 pyrroloquinoline quinone biosynthesis protein PqqE [Rhizobium sp. B209b/85]MBO9168166.1 pyrroloquinoline quinone biosynthesis protein PqqE [Rhizobium sp. L245/93]MBO9184211.1 pyrroloquinoline quinone biosynthesis protein PqqE [Rhizobium sp. E27B/91]QXZ84416.1 pyrroloquinoline quinone biosynthesis protein P